MQTAPQPKPAGRRWPRNRPLTTEVGNSQTSGGKGCSSLREIVAGNGRRGSVANPPLRGSQAPSTVVIASDRATIEVALPAEEATMVADRLAELLVARR